MGENYYYKFINFFQRQNLYNKEAFDYFRNNSILFDYLDTDYHPFIGCFYIEQKGILKKINLIVPHINNDITVLINIHEYTHALILYQYINKVFQDDITTEILPLFYERLYLEENKDNIFLQEHINNINKRITESNTQEIIKYKIALDIQNDLLEYYNSSSKDIKKLISKAKKLVKKQNCNLSSNMIQ